MQPGGISYITEACSCENGWQWQEAVRAYALSAMGREYQPLRGQQLDEEASATESEEARLHQLKSQKHLEVQASLQPAVISYGIGDSSRENKQQ